MYEILMGGESIGQAEVNKEGLYYRFHCVCQIKDTGIHRIYVSDGENQRDLGICVPDNDKFYLEKRIPCKLLKCKNLSFEAVNGSKTAVRVSVEEEKPFEYIEQLETARLMDANGQPEIIIESVQDQPDSGQNPGYLHRWEQQ